MMTSKALTYVGVGLTALVGLTSAVYIGINAIVSSAYDAGYEARKAETLAADKQEFERVLEEVRNANVDVDNPAAVDCFLQHLAGTATEGTIEDCRSVSSDRRETTSPR